MTIAFLIILGIICSIINYKIGYTNGVLDGRVYEKYKKDDKKIYIKE
jgi:hypothetical protein